MPLVIVCHQPGLLGGPLSHQNTWYQVEQDGCLNPQPSPDDFERMRHFTSTFCARDVSEARAAELEWHPDWAEPEPDPEIVEQVEKAPEPVAKEEPDPEVVEPSAMSWKGLRQYASDRGIKATTKAKILAELADL